MLAEKIMIEISKDDALILFDWLARFTEGSCDQTDEIERQSLCNLEAAFEEILVEPFDEKYNEIIAQTKERVRRSMQTEDLEEDVQLEEANQFIAQHPESGRGYIERSEIFSRLGRNVERISDLTTAISLLSSDSHYSSLLCEAYYARGLTYQSMKDHERAIADFNSALELDETYSSVFQARAYSNIEIGELGCARRDLGRAAKLSPGDPHVDELRSRICDSASRKGVSEWSERKDGQCNM